MQRNTARVLILGLSALVMLTATQGGLGQRLPRRGVREGNRLAGVYGLVPLSFEPNVGQTDKTVSFLCRGKGYTLFITHSGEAVLRLAAMPSLEKAPSSISRLEAKRPQGQGNRAESFQLRLAGARTKPQIEGAREFDGKAHCFVGKNPAKWHTNVPLYE